MRGPEELRADHGAVNNEGDQEYCDEGCQG